MPTMRAATLAGPGQIQIQRVPLPEPAAGQVRVRLEGCGVCGSNVPVWEGRSWFRYPLEPGAPGHEGWGAIDSIGSGVSGLSVGERVALLSAHAFAEYDLADAAGVVTLPTELEGVPFPAEPLACALNVFRRCAIRAGQTVAIIGIGFLGALLTCLASKAGARVLAISRRPFARETARRLGAELTLPLESPDEVLRQVREATGSSECDRVIEAAGQAEPLELAGRLTRVRGRLIIAGYHQDGPRQINMQLWNWRGLDVINAHERDPAVYVEGMRRAVAAVVEGSLDPTPLYTHAFGLAELSQALEATRLRPDGFLKALVWMDDAHRS